MFFNTCARTSMTLKPQPMTPDGSRIGLLLDVNSGGTLTMYWEGKPCRTIGEGLVRPLLPCISSVRKDKVVKNLRRAFANAINTTRIRISTFSFSLLYRLIINNCIAEQQNKCKHNIAAWRVACRRVSKDGNFDRCLVGAWK